MTSLARIFYKSFFFYYLNPFSILGKIEKKERKRDVMKNQEKKA